MNKPRLLVLASTYPRWRGDHEPSFVHELSRRLATDFDVHTLCPHAPGALLEENLDGVSVHRFRYAPSCLETLVQHGGIITNLKHHRWKCLLVPLFFLGLAWHTWRLAHRLRPACVHAQWLLPQGLVVALLQQCDAAIPPFLATSHGADLFALREPPFPALKRFVLSRAAAISVVSSPMKEEAVCLGANPESIRVIPMGVDFESVFVPGEAASRQAGEILFVGRLVEKKGLRHLIDALPLVLAQMPHAHLSIAGFGPEEPLLRTLASKLGVAGRVDFLGAVPQTSLPRLYQSAALFVAPFIRTASGDQEGLPVALMEAIACNCPVLAGELSVLSDMFLAEESDFLVQSRDIPELSRKIVALLSDTPAAVSRTSKIRSRLIVRLGWDGIAAEYSKCLRSVALGDFQ